MLDLEKCQITWDEKKNIPQTIYGFRTETLPGEPREIAERFLRENLPVLKITVSLTDLKFDKVVPSLGATAVLFQQYYDETPIHGAWVTIHLDQQNRVFMVKNDAVPQAVLVESSAKVKSEAADPEQSERNIIQKLISYGTLDSQMVREKMWYLHQDKIRPVWKIKFGTREPAGSWILFFDAHDGHLLEERDVLKKATGRGRVFKANPVAALNRDDLFDQRDRDLADFQPAYCNVKLLDLEPGGTLKGPYVNTTATRNCVRCPSYDFRFNRIHQGFEEVMAYYYIDSLQRYIQSLGFNENRPVMRRPIRVNVHGTAEDNSYYNPSPGRKDITYGDGGVDDAEDADIIIHEYGHAVQDDIMPGFGQTHESGSIGEGFSDYLAASFLAKYKKAARQVRFGEWDAKGIKVPQTCLRRLDADKHYPESIVHEVHADGEIWSACLWKIRKLFGRVKADTMILESHFYLTPYTTFKDAAEAIIMANENLYKGKKSKALKKIFQERGILI
jgi:Zn-dependent metalloprotease